MKKFLLSAICFTPFLVLGQNHTGELLYKVKSDLNKSHKSQLDRLNKSLGINSTTSYSNRIVSIFKPASNKLQIESIRRIMQESNLFDFVDYNTIEHQANITNQDPHITKQYHHTIIQSKMARDYVSGNTTLVAVCDSGVEKDHEDLKGILVNGWDFIDNDGVANPATSHGTFVTGLIAANIDNNLGVAGIVPKISILPLRIANSKGGTSMRIITDCIRYAADKGAKVINVSFTGVNRNSVAAAGKYAWNKGALLVYSAGNQGNNYRKWKNKKYVLAVGATTIDDELWRYQSCENSRCIEKGSNIGPFVDIVAPGKNIFSTTTYIEHNPGSAKYRYGSGTSYSTPILTAVAALVASANPKLGPKQIESILKTTAENIGDAYSFGAGRVNAFEAVKKALEY